MKRVLLSALFLIAIPYLVCAQVGALCFFSDPNGNDCTLSDTTPGAMTVYVVHSLVPGASAIEFSAPKPACMVGATWLDDTFLFPVTLGDSQTDVAIGYGSCLTGTIHVLSINYAVSGTTTLDCAYKALPAAGELQINAVDCDNNLVAVNGGTTYINSSLACDCSATTPTPPVLSVTPASLDFGSGATSLPIQISNVGGGTLSWQVFRNPATWLSVSPQSGFDGGTVTVTVNRAGLPPNQSYNGVVNVISNGGAINVPVTMFVPPVPPQLSVTPASLDFGSATTDMSLSISNAGGAILNWDVAEFSPWISASPLAGVNNGVVTVTVDRTGLSPGPYNDVVHVTSNGGNQDVTVTMTVPPPTPVLGFSPSSLFFPQGADSLPLGITNEGTADLLWSVAGDQPWLSVHPAAGTNDTQVMVRVDRSGLPDGNHFGVLNITSNGGNGAVSVTLSVVSPQPILGFSPGSLSFPVGTHALPLDIFNAGQLVLQWNITSDQPWLTVNPAAGTNDLQVTVQVDTTGLGDGTFNGSLSITSNGGNGSVLVSMAVANNPVLLVSPTNLDFSTGITQRVLGIHNAGVGTLQWSVAANRNWIDIVPPLAGTGDASVIVRVDPDSVPAGGTQLGEIAVTSNGGNATVSVRFDPPSSGGAGVLRLAADPGGTDCNILDQAPGLLPVYVVQISTTGSTAAQFSAPRPACWNGAVFLSDTAIFPVTIGSSQTGVAVAYGSCVSAPVLVLAVNYFVQGTGTPCCVYDVLPDPAVPSGQIETVDCAQNLRIAGGSPGYINPNGSCFCGLVPVEETTWGRVKAIYYGSDAAGEK